MVSRVLELRHHMKMSQREFALHTGISLSFLQQVEQGRYKLGAKTAKRISETCNVTEGWLLGRDRFMFKHTPVAYVPPKRPKIRIDDSWVWRRR